MSEKPMNRLTNFSIMVQGGDRFYSKGHRLQKIGPKVLGKIVGWVEARKPNIDEHCLLKNCFISRTYAKKPAFYSKSLF